MKTPADPRHIKRAHLIQELFAWQYHPAPKISKTLQLLIKQLPIIDREIKNAAPTRPIDQINRIDLAILRLAVFELIIEKEQPFRVIADEAVELAKKFGSESSPNLVNGVLGTVIENNKINK